jgi:hypothetical protein
MLKAQPKAQKPAPVVIEAKSPSQEQGRLKLLGGSASDAFNATLANQVVRTLWLDYADKAEIDKLRSAAVAVLVGIGPKDELEGMLAGQIIAAHNAAMECYRRAMIPEQSFEGRKEDLTQANKLSRTYATLLEALNRHRGKGQQKVTVEHVHVHEGGQAIVGNVMQPGGGDGKKTGDQPHAQALAHAPVAPLWSEEPQREPVPRAGDVERAMPDARGAVAGRTEG